MLDGWLQQPCSIFVLVLDKPFSFLYLQVKLDKPFNLSHGDWGLIYSGGTLGSAIAMLFFGGYIDKYKITLNIKVVVISLKFTLLNHDLCEASLVPAIYYFWLEIFWTR